METYTTLLKLKGEPKSRNFTERIPYIGQYCFLSDLDGRIYYDPCRLGKDDVLIGQANNKDEAEVIINADFKERLDNILSFTNYTPKTVE